MLYVIQLQKNKSLGEIMYQIHNSQSFLTFKRNEKLMRYLYFIIILTMYVGIVYIIYIITYNRILFESVPMLYKNLFEVFTLSPIVCLALSFFPLIWRIKIYHNHEFKIVGLSFFYFFIFEIINMAVNQFVIWILLTPKGSDQVYALYISIYVY